MKKVTICIFLLCMILQNPYAQRSDWQRTYQCPGFSKEMRGAHTTYDNGIIFSSSFQADNSHFPKEGSWLVKADINGNILWSKYFNTPDYTFDIDNIEAETNGDIICTGVTSQYDDWNGNAFIMKLNACGEKQWCRYFPYAGGWGCDVKQLSGNRYLLHTVGVSADWTIEENQLWFLDSLGNVQTCSQIVPMYDYPFIYSAWVTSVYITSDHGYLLPGLCYYPQDTTDPMGWQTLQQMLIKMDSLGNHQWVLPTSLDTSRIGCLYSAIEYNNNYYAAGNKRTFSEQMWGYLRKVDPDGNIIYEKVLFPDTVPACTAAIKVLGNNFIQAVEVSTDTASWGKPYTGIFKTDTMGNILKFMENRYGTVTLLNGLSTAIDEKFLVSGFAPYNYVNLQQKNPWIMKINSELDYDTIYNFPFTYDTLCDTIIPQQTTEDCSCDLIVGIDVPLTVKTGPELMVYPNPANTKVKITFNDNKGPNPRPRKILSILDTYGRELKHLPITKEVEINVSDLVPGIYIVTVTSGTTSLTRKKLIIFH